MSRNRTASGVVMGIVLAAVLAGGARGAEAGDAALPAAESTAVRAGRGLPSESRIPHFFEANRGQAPAGWNFLARCTGYHAYIRSGEVVFDFGGAPLGVALDGAREVEPDVRGLELTGRANYLIGNDEAKWITDVPLSRGAAYRGVAPGTTWRFGAKGRRLDFALTVPGTAEPSFRFTGARALSVAPDGALVVRMPRGEAAFTAPVAWQIEATGARRPVTARFDVGEAASDGATPVRIALGARDPHLRTCIDPTVSWSGYLGGSAFDRAEEVRLDASGDVFLAGRTQSSSFPVTSGAYATSYAGSDDAFVAKLSSSGTTLHWATFLGTSGSDLGEFLEIDAGGLPIVGGRTNHDTAFPTTSGSAWPTDPVGTGNTGFAAKLNATGTALVWSTYLPVSGLRGMCLRPSGDLVLAESTGVRGLSGDGSTGTALTVLTPSAPQVASNVRSVHVDRYGFLWVAAESGTPNMPTTTGAYRTTQVGGRDASLTKLAADWTVLASTLYGSTQEDDGQCVGADAAGRPTLVGTYGLSGMPAQGSSDVFVARFSADLATLRSSTTFGGGNGVAPGEDVLAAAVHPTGVLVFAGWVNVSNMPVTDAFQPTYGNNMDGFVAKMSPTNQVVWSSYFGGNNGEFLWSVGMGADGTVVAAGDSSSSGLGTSGVYQPSRGGDTDAVLVRIPDTLPADFVVPEVGDGPPATTIGATQSYAIGGTGGVAPYTFSVKVPPLPAGFALAADGTFSGTAQTVGTATFTVELTEVWGFTATRQFTHVVNPPPTIPPTTLLAWTRGIAMSQQLVSASGTGTHVWSLAGGALPEGVEVAPDGRLLGTPAASGDFGFTVRATDAAGISATRALTLRVNPAPAIEARSVQDWTEGVDQTLAFAVRDGTPPLVWSVVAGTPPLDGFEPSTGVFSGETKSPGLYEFTLRVTDTRGATGERQFAQTVNPFPTIVTAQLPLAAEGRAYATRIDATGGSLPFGFSVAAGELAEGVSLAGDGTLAGIPAEALVSDVTFLLNDSAGAEVRRTLAFECAGAVDLSKRTSKGTFPLVVGSAFRTYRHLELTRGCALSVQVTGGGSKSGRPSLALRRPDGTALDLGKALRTSRTGATLKRFVIPETGRWFLEIAADPGARGKVRFTISIAPPARFTGTTAADGASAPIDIPFAAPPGAKLTIIAKPAKKSTAIPVIAAVTGPGGADVLATGTVKTKGTTVTFTSAGPLAGGDHVLRLGAAPGTAGPLAHTVSLKLPRWYDFALPDLPAGDGE